MLLKSYSKLLKIKLQKPFIYAGFESSVMSSNLVTPIFSFVRRRRNWQRSFFALSFRSNRCPGQISIFSVRGSSYHYQLQFFLSSRCMTPSLFILCKADTFHGCSGLFGYGIPSLKSLFDQRITTCLIRRFHSVRLSDLTVIFVNVFLMSPFDR